MLFVQPCDSKAETRQIMRCKGCFFALANASFCMFHDVHVLGTV